MDAAPIIADWKRRFVAMAESPPYVFRDTPRERVEQHHRKLTTFVPCQVAATLERGTPECWLRPERGRAALPPSSCGLRQSAYGGRVACQVAGAAAQNAFLPPA